MKIKKLLRRQTRKVLCLIKDNDMASSSRNLLKFVSITSLKRPQAYFQGIHRINVKCWNQSRSLSSGVSKPERLVEVGE